MCSTVRLGRCPPKSWLPWTISKPSMAKGATLFGATILGQDIVRTPLREAPCRAYNRQGVFNNFEDNLGTLRKASERAFAQVEIAQHGLVAPFSAS